MTQGEAVFQAVSAVLGGEIDGKVELNKAQLDSVHELVLQMFQTGATTHKSNPDDAALKKYIPGLVNNWLRKDKRLNGGTKYETKRPGSRSGSGDESIKAMRTLLAMTSDPAAKQAIQVEIEKRVAELKPKVTIDVAKLPEALRHLIPQ
jgi:hypothetical protein